MKMPMSLPLIFPIFLFYPSQSIQAATIYSFGSTGGVPGMDQASPLYTVPNPTVGGTAYLGSHSFNSYGEYPIPVHLVNYPFGFQILVQDQSGQYIGSALFSGVLNGSLVPGPSGLLPAYSSTITHSSLYGNYQDPPQALLDLVNHPDRIHLFGRDIGVTKDAGEFIYNVNNYIKIDPPAAVPEPSSWLISAGILVAAIVARRNHRRS